MDYILPALGFDPMPHMAKALTGQYHSAIGPYSLTGELSHNPTLRSGYCEYDSVLKFYGAVVGPLPIRGCTAGKLHTFQLF
jgi:hypothetical protein